MRDLGLQQWFENKNKRFDTKINKKTKSDCTGGRNVDAVRYCQSEQRCINLMEKDEIKQYADDTYGQVSSWINNCDSKASILLALIGVILSIAFTSDKLLGGILTLTKDVVSLMKGDGTSCACASLFILVVLGIAIGFFVDSIKNMLSVLYARMDDSRNAENPSISYYRSIGAKSYDEYKQLVESIDEDAFIEDKLRQVHDCSKICTRKIIHYNDGIASMKVGLVFFVVFLILLIFKNSL